MAQMDMSYNDVKGFGADMGGGVGGCLEVGGGYPEAVQVEGYT